jgi:uncharacterized OsmC-like protein
MTDDVRVETVRSSSIGQPGRSLNSARTNHYVIDSSTNPEALSTVEAFLSGISACGVTLIELQAHQDGVPLEELQVSIDGVRALADTTVFQTINMRFEFSGLDQAEAERLVENYKGR